MRRNVTLALFAVHFAGVLAGVSCSNPRPRAPAIPEERFVDFYARLLIVQEEGKLKRVDPATASVATDSLYSGFGLTRDRVRTELEYYRDDLARWRGLFENVIHRLEQLQHEKQAAPS